MLRGTGMLVSLVLFVGCSSTPSSGAPSPDAATCTDPACVANGGCPEGLARDAASGACLDVIPPDDCPPGTGAFLGSTSCQPIGWTACAAPFEKDPTGWGCRPILAASCPANTIGVLGSAACKPVGDCSAAFPPANATVFVDGTLATEDATHFKHLFDAVQNAKSGDVIAVSPGTYVEDVDVTTSNVTIVGKCPAEVIIKNPGDRRAGILVTQGSKNVTVRGLTLTGHFSGILVKAAGDATLEDSIITSSHYLGAYAAETGSHLRVVRTHIDDVVEDAGKFGWGAASQLGASMDLEDVVIDGATGTGIVIGGAKSTGKLTRVVVRSPRPGTSGFGTALGVVDSGIAELDGAYFGDLQSIGVTVSGGTLTARHMLVTDTKPGAKGSGRGLQVSMGAHLDLAESMIAESDDANVLLVDKGTSATIATSLVRGVLAAGGSRGDHGVRVAGGAALTLTGSALVANIETGLALQDPGSQATVDGVLVTDTRPRKDPTKGEVLGIGVGVAWGATLTMSKSAIVKNHASGFLVANVDASGAVPHADFKSTLIWRTQPNSAGAFGRGGEVTLGAVVTLDGCAVAENSEVSLLAGRDGGRLDVKNTVVRDTKMAAGTFGDGAAVADGGFLTLDGAWLLGHPGIAVAVSAASATLTRSLVARSAIAIQVQGGSTLVTGDQIPAAPDALACFVTNDTQFIDNQTRIGSGFVPLPAPIGDAPRKPATPP